MQARIRSGGKREVTRWRVLIESRLRELPEWADYLIANTLGCSKNTVQAVRAELVAGCQIDNPDRLLGLDGQEGDPPCGGGCWAVRTLRVTIPEPFLQPSSNPEDAKSVAAFLRGLSDAELSQAIGAPQALVDRLPGFTHHHLRSETGAVVQLARDEQQRRRDDQTDRRSRRALVVSTLALLVSAASSFDSLRAVWAAWLAP